MAPKRKTVFLRRELNFRFIVFCFYGIYDGLGEPMFKGGRGYMAIKKGCLPNNPDVLQPGMGGVA